MKAEATLAQQVSDYLTLAYPKVIFRFDYGADVRLTMNQAKKMKALQGRNSKGYPDLFIAQPNKDYAGLYLELKATTPFKKDGTLKKSEHLEKQQERHIQLIEAGYMATFSTGLKETINFIDNYMKGVEK
jgi:hypothetical protein